MYNPILPLIILLGLLAIDAAIEMGFIVGTVNFLNNSAAHTVYEVQNGQSTYDLAGLPAHMLVDQGHTSNGAAGTALVLISIVGALALGGRAVATGQTTTTAASVLSHGLYYLWLGAQIPALLLTTGALGYVIQVTRTHEHQQIDQALAASLDSGAHYPLDTWTPQNWFSAIVSQLALTDADVDGDLRHYVRIMRGWQYNLIPLFLLQLAQTAAAFFDWYLWRKFVRGNKAAGGSVTQKV